MNTKVNPEAKPISRRESFLKITEIAMGAAKDAHAEAMNLLQAQAEPKREKAELAREKAKIERQKDELKRQKAEAKRQKAEDKRKKSKRK